MGGAPVGEGREQNLNEHRAHHVQLDVMNAWPARRHKPLVEFVAAGGLLSYGGSITEHFKVRGGNGAVQRADNLFQDASCVLGRKCVSGEEGNHAQPHDRWQPGKELFLEGRRLDFRDCYGCQAYSTR